MRRSWQVGVAVGVAVAAGWLGACAGGVGGRGRAWRDMGASYRGGELHVAVEAAPEEVVAAARRALGEMRITLLDAEATEVEGQAVGLTAGGERVVVQAVRETAGPAAVTIRVGVLGDEGVSRGVYERMRAGG